MIYEPKSFWKNKGALGEQEFQVPHEQMMQEMYLLRGILNQHDFKSVLEIGAGSGRFTKFICENFHIETYVCLDYSADRLNRLLDSIPSWDLRNKEMTITCIPKSYNATFVTNEIEKFDIVFLSHVLLHIPPFEIADFVDRLFTNCKGEIINIDYFESSGVPSQELADYNFLYNYPSLFKQIGRGRVKHIDRVKVDEWVSIFRTGVRSL